ncbi:MAG: hypothetical protein J5842_05490 [Lachnospiraceae bacterium]|nr:hypothetical protein [Lachnospiraceae bacterium]
MSKKGVYETKLKNGTVSFRASLTCSGRHISLGSYDSEKKAHKAYVEGSAILADKQGELYSIDRFEDISRGLTLYPQKAIMLMNLRDNGIYIAAPIYIYSNYFHYYLSESVHLTFDRDDLFYYARHRIMQRKGHYFVADYGMQVTITGRYGIRPYAVKGRDYVFVNGDDTDFRYNNISIINPYHGVLREGEYGSYRYRALIHLNGNHTIGVYEDMTEAAIAYNKAVDACKNAGIDNSFPVNYIENLTGREYADIYEKTELSKRLCEYLRSVKLSTASGNQQS